jgi:virulence-associated protein VapD
MYKLTVTNRTNQALYHAARELNLILVEEQRDILPRRGYFSEDMVDDVELDITEEVAAAYAEVGIKALVDYVRNTYVDITDEPHLKQHGEFTRIRGRVYMRPAAHATATETAIEASNAIMATYKKAQTIALPEVGSIHYIAGKTVMVIDQFDGRERGVPNRVHLLVDGRSCEITAAELRYIIASGVWNAALPAIKYDHRMNID